MRRFTSMISALAVVLAIAGCDNDEGSETESTPATEPAAAAPSNPVAASITARIGGVIVNAQRFFVEVFPRANGEVEAKIYDAQGNEVTGEAGATLVVKVQGKDQQAHDVAMQWDAEAGRFRGTAGANVEVDTGRVEVTVTPSEGEAATGSVDKVAVAPQAQGGGTVLIAGELSAEVRAEADGKVNAVVLDATGAPITGEGEAEVTVNLKGPDDTVRPVQLAWNAEMNHWVGRIEGEFQATPGPMEIVIERRGASHRGRVEVAAIAPAPRAGGQIVITGDHAVELVPAAEGKVEAIVLDARGRPVTGQANARLTVNVGVGADMRAVQLNWDAEREKWVGDAQTQVEIGTTPVEVVLVTNGHRRRGRWGRGLALGHAHARGQAGVDVAVPGAGVRVDAPGADVRVRVPGQDVRVGAGSVRVNRPGAGVRVGAPGAGVQVRGGAAGGAAGGSVSVSAMAGADVSGAAAQARAQAEEARRQAAEARRRAAEARGAATGGVSVMGGVSIMGGGGIGIGQ